MTNDKKRPFVSVGMPIYNEGKYLEKTLDSIISQFKDSSFDYEIIITDNASTDSTKNIVNEYMLKYPEIKYVKNKRNLGSVDNFNKAFRLSKGKYFMWAAGHDLWSARYITACLKVMQSDEDVVIAYPKMLWIDENGSKLNYKSGFVDTRGNHVYSRFNLTLWTDAHAIHGLIRSDVLKKTSLMRYTIATDGILLAELALAGEFAYVPEEVWYRRKIRGGEILEQQVERYKKELFSGRGYIQSKLPNWKIPYEYFRVIWNGPLTFNNKIHLALVVIPVVFLHYFRAMIYDITHIFS